MFPLKKKLLVLMWTFIQTTMTVQKICLPFFKTTLISSLAMKNASKHIRDLRPNFAIMLIGNQRILNHEKTSPLFKMLPQPSQLPVINCLNVHETLLFIDLYHRKKDALCQKNP